MNISRKELLILLTIFILIFILNCLTPHLLDDFFYSLKFGTSEKITSLFDIINFQKEHYLNWGGRVLAHSIAQVFLIQPKIIFNILNSFMFIIEGLLIYKLVFKQEKNNMYLILIYLLLWFINPVFGQINLWLVGSCNYLWTTCILLFYFYLFTKNNNNKTEKFILIIFSFLAGLCNENSSLAIIIMTILYSCFIYKKIDKVKISCILFSIIVYIFLIIAPGNFSRVGDGNILSIINTVILNFQQKYVYLLIIFIIFSMLIILLNKKFKNKMVIIYLIGLFVSIFSLIIVPISYLRNFYFAIVLVIICLTIITKELHKKTMKGVICLLLVVFVIQYSFTLNDYIKFYNFYTKRYIDLKYASAHDIKTIKLETYFSKNSKIPISVDELDLQKSPDKFPNFELSNYYGVDKIIGYNKK